MLQLVNDKGEKLLIMSTQAYHILTPNQIQSLEKHARIVHSSLDTIEACGGGSARYTPNQKFSIKQWADDDKPREKMMLKGQSALSDAELLAILIGSGTRDESAVDLCKRILQAVNHNWSELSKMSLSKLKQFKGIGDAKAVTIMAALELGRRRKAENTKPLKENGKEIIEISEEQVNNFAGNMLQLVNDKGEKLLIMSTQAYHILTPNQIQSLEKHARIVHSSLDTIEACGGGSARYTPNQKFSIKQWADDDKPREKMMLKGQSALSDAELLAILIGSGTRDESAVDLCKRILQAVNHNWSELSKMSLSKLKQFKGIGDAKAVTIMAALELGRRRKAENTKPVRIQSSRDAYEY
ncbi:hypothetical protein GWI33_011022, partial [Rhynchophorus ferrugineus]